LIYAIAGVGGVVGALLAAPTQKYFRFGQLMIGTYWFWSLLLPLYLFASNTLALGLITALTFTLGSVYTVAQFSFRLSLIPDALQGRVTSVFRLVAFLGPPLGSMITGTLLQTLGIAPTVPDIHGPARDRFPHNHVQQAYAPGSLRTITYILKDIVPILPLYSSE